MQSLSVSACSVAGKAYRLVKQLLDTKIYYIFTRVESLLYYIRTLIGTRFLFHRQKSPVDFCAL